MDLDPTAQFGAVTRVVSLRERDGKQARAVIVTRTYPTDRADLWDALTNAERLPRWFLPISGDLVPGGRYQLRGNAGGSIEACEAPERFAVTWEFGAGVSWVEVRLVAEPGEAPRTTLILEHVAHVDGHYGRYGPGAVGVGWELGLIGLDLHVRSRAAVDPAAFQAWSAGAGGQAFVKASAHGWGEAATAAGDPADEARAAAARTGAFYSGEPEPT